MKEEHIRITGNHIDKANRQGEWKVSCDFIFQNMTDKPINLTMGFPFPVYQPDENVTAPTGISPKKDGPLVYQFILTVDGKKVPAVRQRIAFNPEKGLYYNDAYIWQIQFTPHQFLKVHHDYITGVM